ncbi:hypothetical protein Tco_0194686 [Tanacetum coccineum]
MAIVTTGAISVSSPSGGVGVAIRFFNATEAVSDSRVAIEHTPASVFFPSVTVPRGRGPVPRAKGVTPYPSDPLGAISKVQPGLQTFSLILAHLFPDDRQDVIIVLFTELLDTGLGRSVVLSGVFLSSPRGVPDSDLYLARISCYPGMKHLLRAPSEFVENPAQGNETPLTLSWEQIPRLDSGVRVTLEFPYLPAQGPSEIFGIWSDIIGITWLSFPFKSFEHISS